MPNPDDLFEGHTGLVVKGGQAEIVKDGQGASFDFCDLPALTVFSLGHLPPVE
jgi:hypothetical protein